VRRTERELVVEYRDLVTRALDHLRPETEATVLELCELPDEIRGYEDIKLRSVRRFRIKAAQLRRTLADGHASRMPAS
jgi:indolepyruvate ferredoxin oxidoreductase